MSRLPLNFYAYIRTCIAGNFPGNFRGSKHSWLVEQYLVSSWILFSWLLLALQVKVVKVASFVGKIFVLRDSTTKTTNILSPSPKITCYTVVDPSTTVIINKVVRRAYDRDRVVQLSLLVVWVGVGDGLEQWCTRCI